MEKLGLNSVERRCQKELGELNMWSISEQNKAGVSHRNISSGLREQKVLKREKAAPTEPK